MLHHSKKLDFENAKLIKEKIIALNNYQSKSVIVSPKINNVDVFTIYTKNDLAFINYMKVINVKYIN